MLLANGEILHARLRVDLDAILLGHFSHAPGGRFQIEDGGGAIQAQDDVFGHGERPHQTKMLVNHANAQRDGSGRRVNGDRLAVDENLSLFGRIQPKKNVHQCGFAGPIFPQQPVNLPGMKL